MNIVKFAYYTDPFEEIPAEPSYLILESEVKSLPKHGNVCHEQLRKEGINIPMTPTYQTWVNMGKPIYRG